MARGKKKAKKSQDMAPSASEQQCSEPVNASMCSEPVKESMSDGVSKRFREDTPGINKNKETITSSETLSTNTDELSMKPEPSESDLEELTHIKNTCRALKSNLNAMKKKFEEEKQEKEKLYVETKDLKSKLSSLERELQVAKMQLQNFKKGNAQHQKSSEKDVEMDIETPMDNVYQHQEQEISLDFTREEKKDNLVQYNLQGAREKAGSIVMQDTEMTESFNREKSGHTKGNDQYKDGNFHVVDEKQWGGEADCWDANWSSSQPSNNSSVPPASGSDTRRQERRGCDTGQKRNEWRQPSNRNEDQPDTRRDERRGYYTGQKRNEWPQPPNRNEEQQDTRRQERRGCDTGQKHNEWHQSPNRNEKQPPHTNEEQHHGPHHYRYLGRGQALGSRDNRGQNNRGGMGGRGDLGQNYNHIENNLDRYCHGMRTTDEQPVVTEVSGDLFEAPNDCSLAHCVAEDMRMGSGIAVTFRQKYKRVDELLEQRQGQGHVAVLEDEGRYIYYLVTKRECNGKPTMKTLQRSLEAMRDHVIANEVKKIAMPRIGCGLDRLDWRNVKPLIEKIFLGTGAQITVYNYNEEMADSSKCKPTGEMADSSKCKPTSQVRLKYTNKPVAAIEQGTAILCLCAADGTVDSTFESLDRKFRILTDYQNMDRKLGNIHHISKPQYLILLLIVKEKKSSLLSFLALGECMRQACKLIEKKKYYYVAVESLDDKNDPFLFERVITVIKNYLDTKWDKELWLCCPKEVSARNNARPTY